MITPHQDAPASELVTVVVPHYGAPGPTLALLAQLRAQRDVPGLRIVVSDDASPEPLVLPPEAATGPGAPERAAPARSPQAPAPSTPPAAVAQDRARPVTLLRRSRNGGFGANVNTALERVSTPYALVLNSDLEVGERFVADLLEAARPWQPCVVAPRVRSADGSEQHAGRHFPTVGHQTVEWLSPLARWRHTRVLHEAVGHDTRAAGPGTTSVDWVTGAALLLPVAEVRAVGGFDESYFMNAEEVDLQRRLRERGVPSLVAGDVTVTHAGGGSSDARRRRAWLVAARSRYARRWGRPRTLTAALTAATGVNLAVNTVRAAAGRDVHPLRVAREELALIHPGLRPGAGGRR
ncbi:glycosyltransferase family 2 protein [Kocuria sp.]|uniref:glycosyltransferase family 2 protein n=1 Tax=Kocuria sp. TaxID=1871328 RepID=UPI0026DB9588|nr:glycosyltransferase family 2 protein [Kocuria sp.]MDO4919664.1 glycosyltransferase family 2 protein [Kocuria sp.]